MERPRISWRPYPFLAAALMTSLVGCARVGGDVDITVVPPTPAPTATPTTAASVTASAATAAALATALPTVPRPQVVVVGTPVPTRAPAAQARMVKMKIVMIALEDNGKLGRKIGCGDSAVAVDVMVPDGDKPIAAALDALLSQHDQKYGQSGLYNALAASNLKLDNTDVVGGRVNVKLSGTLQLGGACDGPRVAAQLGDTVAQFAWSRNPLITLNGQPLDRALSPR